LSYVRPVAISRFDAHPKEVPLEQFFALSHSLWLFEIFRPEVIGRLFFFLFSFLSVTNDGSFSAPIRPSSWKAPTA